MKKVFKRKILISFFVLIGLLWFWNKERIVSLRIPSSSGTDYILQLPNKDKKRLCYFFRTLMLWDKAIYTLVGNKPMSLGGYNNPLASFKLLDLYHSFLPDNLKMYWAWKTYLKYQYLFENSKFMIWSEESPWGKNANIILFANKEEVASIIKHYSNDFNSVLKTEHVDIEELFQESQQKPFFLEGLHKHEGLIGTLLGYGRENAWLFFRKHSLGENIDILSSFSDNTPEELKTLVKLLLFSYIGKEPEDISEALFLPYFAADVHSEETKQLKENYCLTRERILETYKGKNFLETTLSLLMNSDLKANQQNL